MSKKRDKEIKVWEYFIPKYCNWQEKTDKDIQMFFEWSEQGKHKDIKNIHTYKPEGRTYFHALVWGKRRAGINIHELWEQSFNAHDGSWLGYKNLLEDMPAEVKEYVMNEIFKGTDKEISTY